MARYLLGTSSLGMLATISALIMANWIVAIATFVVTLTVLTLGLDWAVKLHHGEIRLPRPQFLLGFLRTES